MQKQNKNQVTHWEIREVNLSDVNFYDENPRSIKSDNMKGLKSSLERFGYVDPIVWNETTGNIVGGHQRCKVLLEKDVETATMIVVNMSEDKEKAANLTLNNPKIEGDWDDPINELMDYIEGDNPELFKDVNFDKLRKDVAKKVPSSEPDDTDTECPCCGHRWQITDTEIKILTQEEKEKYGIISSDAVQGKSGLQGMQGIQSELENDI